MVGCWRRKGRARARAPHPRPPPRPPTHTYPPYTHPHVPSRRCMRRDQKPTNRAGGMSKEVGKGQRGEGSNTLGSTTRLQEGPRRAQGRCSLHPPPQTPLPRPEAPSGERRWPAGRGSCVPRPAPPAPAKRVAASSATAALPPAQEPRRPAPPAIGSLKMPL